MAEVSVRVELSDKEVRDAILEVAKKSAGAGAGGAKVHVRASERPNGANELSAVVEFQRKAIE